MLNTANVDFRYTSAELPVLVFSRVQLVPRLEGGAGELTRVFLEQAFGRIAPIKSAELAITVGKFDSVFGIEYLENQANFRDRHHALVARALHDRDVGRRQGVLPLSSSSRSRRR